MPVTSDEEEDKDLSDRQFNASGSSDVDGEEELVEDDADDVDDDSRGSNSPPRPLQNYFAPPFYGRPPTPLPPSPSLTSLLRPSRPTTPDASDDDFEPVPRAAPQVPTYEYYGFVLYLFSSLTFLMYLLWSYLPSPFLHALGIYYYPNRWWSLAIPAFLVTALVYIYVALAAYNTEILTVPMGSVETVVDDCAMVAVLDERGRPPRAAGRGSGGGRHRDGVEGRATRRKDAGRNGRSGGRPRGIHGGGGQGGGYGAGNGSGNGNGNVNGHGTLNWRKVWNEGTDAVMDVPLAGVCEVLYGEGTSSYEEDGESDS